MCFGQGHADSRSGIRTQVCPTIKRISVFALRCFFTVHVPTDSQHPSPPVGSERRMLPPKPCLQPQECCWSAWDVKVFREKRIPKPHTRRPRDLPVVTVIAPWVPPRPRLTLLRTPRGPLAFS